MTEQDKPQFTTAITALCETLGREASTATLYGYWVALSDLPIAAVQRAVMRALRESKFLPAPAELRQFAGEQSVDDRAILAWATVEKATAIGSYKTVDFSDPVINATIRTLGGWPAILEKSPKEFDTFTRASFLKSYASLARTGVTGDVCAPLPGLSEQGTHEVTGLGQVNHTVKIGVTRIKSLSENGVPNIDRDKNKLPRLHSERPVDQQATRATP